MSNKKGRKTLYDEKYAEQAYKLCLLGATDVELADFFHVNPDTIYRWKIKHFEFSESIKKGKFAADANVADKLYNRACGYSHKAIKIFNNQGDIVTQEYTEHYPPDTTAAIFWLKNRQPAKWRDKVEVDQKTEHSGVVENKIVVEFVE